MNLLPRLDSGDLFSPPGSRYPSKYHIRPSTGGSDHVMLNDSVFGNGVDYLPGLSTKLTKKNSALMSISRGPR